MHARAWAGALLLLAQINSSPLTNPLREDGDVSQVIPAYLMTSSSKKAYYNETPAHHLEATAVKKKKHVITGRHESCSNIEFDVKWSTTVSSSVYSSPLMFMSSEGKKHVLVSTFYQTLEMLEATGFKPWGWPTTFEGSTFQGSPVLYDVDGDGIDDLGVVDKNANVFFVRTGEFGQYLEDYHMQVPSLRVKKDWHTGLDAEFSDYNAMTSMFDRKQRGYRTGSDRSAAAAQAQAAAAAADHEGGTSSSSSAAKPPKVVTPDDLSFSRPPPKATKGGGGGSSANTNSRFVPRRAGGGPGDPPPHGRRLLAEEDQENSNKAGEGEGAGLGDFSGDLNEAPPPSAQTDDFSPTSRFADSYYGRISGGGSNHRPFRSYDDGYPYDSMLGFMNESAFVNIDPHVLGSPVVVDVNNDGRLELIMAVSYYFDRADHAAMKERGAEIDFDPSNYVAGGVVCWDLASQEWSWTVHLDLTTDKSKFKALIYASPTVADLDGDGRYEVLIGTSLGLLYVLDGETGFARRHFPMQFHEIQAQIAVADLRGGLHLEIIVADLGGNLVLVDIDGEILWDAKLSGRLPYTPSVGDIDGDGQLDVLVVAVLPDDSSHLWAVDGATGVTLLGFPIKPPRGGIFSASALLVDLSVYGGGGGGGGNGGGGGGGGGSGGGGAGLTVQATRSRGLHILIPSFDGFVYVIDGLRKCYDRLDVGDRLVSTPLLEDLNGDGLLDLVLGSVNGQVMSIGTSMPSHPINVWGSFPRARANGFVTGQTGIAITKDIGLQPRKDTTADHQNYTIAFEIWDHRRDPDAAAAAAAAAGAGGNGNGHDHQHHHQYEPALGVLGLERKYQVTISANSNQAAPLFRADYTKPGVYTVNIPIQPPEHVALYVAMINDHGQKFEDTFVLRADTTFHGSVKYLSLSLLIGLTGLLMLLV